MKRLVEHLLQRFDTLADGMEAVLIGSITGSSCLMHIEYMRGGHRAGVSQQTLHMTRFASTYIMWSIPGWPLHGPWSQWRPGSRQPQSAAETKSAPPAAPTPWLAIVRTDTSGKQGHAACTQAATDVVERRLLKSHLDNCQDAGRKCRCICLHSSSEQHVRPTTTKRCSIHPTAQTEGCLLFPQHALYGFPR